VSETLWSDIMVNRLIKIVEEAAQKKDMPKFGRGDFRNQRRCNGAADGLTVGPAGRYRRGDARLIYGSAATVIGDRSDGNASTWA
jgi:hypothetical protein